MNSKGFTLIELLVVIVIVGILSAIAIPSFLNQTSKAKQSEAKSSVGAINSAQTAYRTENPSFADGFDKLALGLPTATNNYLYAMSGTQDTATVTATPKDTALKGYVGGNVRYQIAANSGIQSAIGSILCETKTAGATTPPALPQLDPTQTSTQSAAQCDSTEVPL